MGLCRIPLLALLLAFAGAAAAQEQPAAADVKEQPAAADVRMSAAELFRFADSLRDAGDLEAAETAYRALAADPDSALRNEARFRLAQMLAEKLARYRDAAVLLRAILDEQPEIARVRVELARMHALLGDRRAAEQELRSAQAIGLPPEVEQLVRFYAAALNAQRPNGARFELALAPDSNINRATRSETIGTIIGDLELSEDAQAQSGVGLSVQGQGWHRFDLAADTDLLARVSIDANAYRQSSFDDYSAAMEIGPQFRTGDNLLTVSASTSWRWFGQRPYAFTYGLSAAHQHPLNRRTLLRLDASATRSDDRLNALRSANRFALAAGVDHAINARLGAGLQLSGRRELAQEAAYSTASGGVSGYLYRELGKTTLVLNLSLSHLEADQRLSLYRERRKDDRLAVGLSGTFRSLRVGTFAPVVRFLYERNTSTVKLYSHRRLAAEFGVAAAF